MLKPGLKTIQHGLIVQRQIKHLSTDVAQDLKPYVNEHETNKWSSGSSFWKHKLQIETTDQPCFHKQSFVGPYYEALAKKYHKLKGRYGSSETHRVK